jgi:DNA-binding MarR family transcriptional regulator
MMSHLHRRSAGDTLAVMNEAGLTMPQMVTLHMLAHGGPRSVGAIAGCLRLSAAAASHLVDRLVGTRLVERTEDPVDRRQKRVVITESGRTLADRVQQERTREIAQVLAQLSDEVQQQFADVLVRVVEELKALPGPEDRENSPSEDEP